MIEKARKSDKESGKKTSSKQEKASRKTEIVSQKTQASQRGKMSQKIENSQKTKASQKGKTSQKKETAPKTKKSQQKAEEPQLKAEESHEMTTEANTDFTTHSGFVAIVGRPNVGKSTLLNSILGEKLSIISSKPQTTRHRILGVKTGKEIQAIYVDTPGLHLGERREINKYMNQTARRALKDVDVVAFVVEGLEWTEEDEMVLRLIAKVTCPVLLVVNKIDEIKEKVKLLPHLKMLAEKFSFKEIIPISAKTGDNVGALEKKIANLLPLGPFYFPEGQITDRSIRFRLSEMIREKLMFELDQEIPYGTTVEIEMYEEEERRTLVYAVIWVDKPSHKPIVIGKQGAVLKKIGIAARKDMENLLDRPVHLKLWVKVKGGWSDDARALKSLGYIDLG